MTQTRFKIGDRVYRATGSWRHGEDLNMDDKPYVITCIQVRTDAKGSNINYTLSAPGYDELRTYDSSDEEVTFATLQEGEAFLKKRKQPQQMPSSGSTLEKKFRRRWVGGRYVDEPIDP